MQEAYIKNVFKNNLFEPDSIPATPVDLLIRED
jgi:hypothetical protein